VSAVLSAPPRIWPTRQSWPCKSGCRLLLSGSRCRPTCSWSSSCRSRHSFRSARHARGHTLLARWLEYAAWRASHLAHLDRPAHEASRLLNYYRTSRHRHALLLPIAFELPDRFAPPTVPPACIGGDRESWSALVGSPVRPCRNRPCMSVVCPPASSRP